MMSPRTHEKRSVRQALWGAALMLALVPAAGCGGGGGSSGGVGPAPVPTPTASPAKHQRHVVVIVQENRTVDNLFHVLPGVDTQAYGLNSKGQHVALLPVPLQVQYDPDHTHFGFATEYNNGAMNGFDLEASECGAPPGGYKCPSYQNIYTYVQASDIQPYLLLAQRFALADRVLQTNQGPSYPAHFYLIAAQSGRPMAVAENASNLNGGCDAPEDVRVGYVDLTQPYPGLPESHGSPCIDFPTIFDELDAANVTWRYYAPYQDNLWNPANAIRHLFASPEFRKNVVYPETTILSDVKNGKLPEVSYVVPQLIYSDHPRGANAQGPDWVATVTNAIGESQYWNDTTILLVWDDWGGWYDHYKPVAPPGSPNDPYEFGFRVPLLVISPFVRQAGLIDHKQRDFTSILRFIERTYNLPALTALDANADDLTGMLDFSHAPLPYTHIDTPGFTPYSFMHRPPARARD
jgi:phospholipase C